MTCVLDAAFPFSCVMIPATTGSSSVVSVLPPAMGASEHPVKTDNEKFIRNNGRRKLSFNEDGETYLNKFFIGTRLNSKLEIQNPKLLYALVI